MAGSLNRVELIGHLGADPELRQTQDGRPVARMRIATSDRWRDKETGERRERTEWHTVIVFNEALCKLAEQYLKKGSKVYIEGQLQTREWEDKDGQRRFSTEIVLRVFDAKILMLEGASDGHKFPASEDEYGQTCTRESAASAGQSYADVKGNAREPIYTSQGAMQPGEFTRGAPAGGVRTFDDDEVPF